VDLGERQELDGATERVADRARQQAADPAVLAGPRPQVRRARRTSLVRAPGQLAQRGQAVDLGA
jgi:hypothetical protein